MHNFGLEFTEGFKCGNILGHQVFSDAIHAWLCQIENRLISCSCFYYFLFAPLPCLSLSPSFPALCLFTWYLLFLLLYFSLWQASSQQLKFTTSDSCDRIKDEFQFLQAQYHRCKEKHWRAHKQYITKYIPRLYMHQEQFCFIFKYSSFSLH